MQKRAKTNRDSIAYAHARSAFNFPPEDDSSSSALRFATVTVAGGKPASSATLMPKDSVQGPSATS